jgi:hypothetical protein
MIDRSELVKAYTAPRQCPQEPMSDFDFLACDTPEQAIAMLYRLADRLHADAAELRSEWQTKVAGRFWDILADELDCVGRKMEKYTLNLNQI